MTESVYLPLYKYYSDSIEFSGNIPRRNTQICNTAPLALLVQIFTTLVVVFFEFKITTLPIGFSIEKSSVGLILLVSFCTGFYSIIIRYACINNFVASLILFQVFLIFCIISLIMYAGREKT
ncbi:MAG: hypothetical protein ABDH23_00895 [Endomicrobiia bacterium]